MVTPAINPVVNAAAPAYQVRAGDVSADEQAILEVWQEGGMGLSAGLEADRERFRWFYLANPEGRAFLNLLSASGSEAPVGFLGIGLRRFFMGDEALLAGTLVDFVVSPRHRSAFPALTLQRKGRELALRAVQFLYGLPDTKAVAVCKRLESHVRFELPRFARVIRSRPYFERLVPAWVATPLATFTDVLDRAGTRLQLLFSGLHGQWAREFDSNFDALWQSVNKQGLCIGVRDRAFLQWRFGQQPGHNYLIFVVRKRSSSELQTYFVCEASAKTLTVKDWLSSAAEGDLKAALLLLSVAARKLGVGAVEIQISGTQSQRKALPRAQFVLRSHRPFFAVVGEPLRERAAALRWYITQADEDI